MGSTVIPIPLTMATMRAPPRPAAVLLLLLAGGTASAGGDPPAGAPAPPPAPAAEVTPEARDAAIRAAIAYLCDNLSKMQEGGSPQGPYATATAAWAGLLLQARKGAPRFPGRKEEQLRDAVERYVERVARAYDRSAKDEKKGKPAGPEPPAGVPPGDLALTKPPGEATQFVWPISMAAHLLAESAARGWNAPDARASLVKIVKVLEASQQSNGGWGHDDASRPGMGLPAIRIPKPWGEGSLDYPHTLLASTNCALSALGTAHRILGTKKAPSLAKALKYYADAQSEDGTFPYDPTQRRAGEAGGESPFEAIEISRTAGSVFAMGCAGPPPEDPVLAKAVGAVAGKTALFSEGHGSATMTLQLAALCCRSRGAKEWEAFRREFFPRILAAQEKDGAFRCICKEVCPGVICDSKPLPGGLPGESAYAAGTRTYVTALHLLVLALDSDDPPKALPVIRVREGTATEK
jgi:hypothetical protein